MPLYRKAEIILYAVLNVLPYMVLNFYSVRKSWRFSHRTTAAILILSAIPSIIASFIATTTASSSAILAPLSQLTLAVMFIAATKQPLGKDLFLLIIMSNIASCLSVCAKCLESILFPHLAMQSHRWSFALCLLILQILFLIPPSFYLRWTYEPIMSSSKERRLWGYLWIIPFTFYFIWYHRLHFSTVPLIEQATQPVTGIMYFLTTLASLLIYHVVVLMIQEQNKNLTLKKNESRLHLQHAQYEAIMDKIQEARKKKHDMRHHLRVIASYANEGKMQEISDYLSRYDQSLGNTYIGSYCANNAVNALLQYFYAQSTDAGVAFEVAALVPEKTTIPDEEITVILGNLLENAYEASSSEPKGTAKINVQIKTKQDFMYFRISNTFTGYTKQTEDGLYLSTKSDNRGLGLRSVRDIVEKNEGMIKIKQDNQLFTVYIMLSLMQ